MPDKSQDRVLIVDFGSQVTQLIARRVREAGVYSEIVPFDKAEGLLAEERPAAIILSGGPASVHESGTPQAAPAIFSAGVPVLGICYGEQAMVAALGGQVEGGHSREFGRAELQVIDETPLFDGVFEEGERAQVWMSHGDRVTRLPPGFRAVGISTGAPFAAIADDSRRLLRRAVPSRGGAHAEGSGAAQAISCAPSPAARATGAWRSSARPRSRASASTVGDAHVVCGLSGGVDSSVAALLIHEAIGDQLTCIFVDHGLLREGEAKEVAELFRGHYNIPLIAVDAAARFLDALKGVSDPEEKRKTIGRLFVDVFEDEAEKIGHVDFLAQGTLYPDVIESVSPTGGPSATIKSHHNVGGLPERMRLKLIEPLRELFKDEVRALGRELGLPDAFVNRHPFPGPGLAIRIPGEVTEEKLAVLRKADAIYLDEIRKQGLYDKIWQAFAVLLPVRTVGVMGDARTYDFVCALRAVTSTDGMTADYYDFSHDFLGHAARRIINEVRGINRVVYDITSKPPGTIEWE